MRRPKDTQRIRRFFGDIVKRGNGAKRYPRKYRHILFDDVED